MLSSTNSTYCTMYHSTNVYSTVCTIIYSTNDTTINSINITMVTTINHTINCTNSGVNTNRTTISIISDITGFTTSNIAVCGREIN